MNIKKIGIVIADDMEYKPLNDLGGAPFSFYGRTGRAFTFEKDDKKIELYSVCCGIGKVNAASAAMYLAEKGCEIILNAGLSGGVNGVARGELVLANRYIEYDFDLTPLGYKMAEKPSQKYIYDADEMLLEYFSKSLKISKSGMAVTGDRFVSDENTRQYLINEYNAQSCDMESAAIASVCFVAGIPFLSLRRISDDAGASATDSYRDMNENENFNLVVLLYNAVRSMLECEKFFG